MAPYFLLGSFTRHISGLEINLRFILISSFQLCAIQLVSSQLSTTDFFVNSRNTSNFSSSPLRSTTRGYVPASDLNVTTVTVVPPSTQGIPTSLIPTTPKYTLPSTYFPSPSVNSINTASSSSVSRIATTFPVVYSTVHSSTLASAFSRISTSFPQLISTSSLVGSSSNIATPNRGSLMNSTESTSGRVITSFGTIGNGSAATNSISATSTTVSDFANNITVSTISNNISVISTSNDGSTQRGIINYSYTTFVATTTTSVPASDKAWNVQLVFELSDNSSYLDNALNGSSTMDDQYVASLFLESLLDNLNVSGNRIQDVTASRVSLQNSSDSLVLQFVIMAGSHPTAADVVDAMKQQWYNGTFSLTPSNDTLMQPTDIYAWTDYGPCIQGRPCENGGRCLSYQQPGNLYCQCVAPYNGTYCTDTGYTKPTSNQPSQAELDPPWKLPVIIVCTVVPALTIFILVVACCCALGKCKTKSKRLKRRQRSESRGELIVEEVYNPTMSAGSIVFENQQNPGGEVRAIEMRNNPEGTDHPDIYQTLGREATVRGLAYNESTFVRGNESRGGAGLENGMSWSLFTPGMF